MRKLGVWVSLTLLVGMLCVGRAVAQDVGEAVSKVQDISVTLKTNYSEGSGTIISREIDTGDKKEIINFILTAAHVIDDLRKVRTVIENGRDHKMVEFDDAFIVVEENQGGRRVGESKMDCKILNYSDADDEHDIALLMVIKHGYKPLEISAEFYLDEKLIPVGTQLYHCGSLNGMMGSNSVTDGIMSQIGRMYEGQVYDQISCPAFSGSSGGGVFIVKNNNPLFVGIVVRGIGESFTLKIPIRRIHKWSKERSLEWLLDPKITPPTLKEILKMPIEIQSNGKVEKKLQEPTPAKKKFVFLDGKHAEEFYNIGGNNGEIVEKKGNKIER